jgi:predicted acetyltransferase/predicted GNAT family acetyltransferase
MSGDVKRARPEQSGVLSELALRSKAHWDYPADFLEACREELTLSPDLIAAQPTFVLEQDGRPVGVYSLERHSRSRVELGHLFVEPDQIGRGLGRRLLDHATEQARKAGFVTLVIQSDPNAEPFYLAAGAERVDITPSASIPGRELPLLELDLLDSYAASGPRLVSPRARLREAFIEMAEEFAAGGDDRYAPARRDFSAYLALGRRLATDGGLPADRVAMDEFWLVEGDRLLGGTRLRHRLIPVLELDGGHIGYDIRPSARRRGFGHAILALSIQRARAIGIDRVLLTCETTNPGSARIIERAGGVRIPNSISARTGNEMMRFWIG